MGFPGKGKAITDLKNIRSFFESIPFSRMKPSDELCSRGYCLSIPGEICVLYLPDGGSADIDLKDFKNRKITGKWYDPVSGAWQSSFSLKTGINTVKAPSEGKDWVFMVK
jgi:hypothetical protein